MGRAESLPRQTVRRRVRAGWAQPRGVVLAAAGILAVAGCAADDVGPRLVVTSGFTDEVLLLDPADGRITRRLSLDPRPGERDEPHGVAVSPDGVHWLATTSHGDPSLSMYEVDGDRLVGRVSLGLPGAGRPGIRPDGQVAVVPDYWLGGTGQTSGAAVVRLDDLAVTERLSLCPAPHQAEYSPDGRWIAVPCPLSDEVLLLSGADYAVRHRIALGLLPGETGSVAPGNPLLRPMNVAWAPSSDRFWVTLMRQGAVAAIDTAGQEVGRGATSREPAQIAVTPDGRRLVIPVRGDFVVEILDAATLETERVVVLADGPHPHGVAISPDGSTAFVTNEGTTRSTGGVTAFRIDDGTVLWRTDAGVFTLGIAWRPAP